MVGGQVEDLAWEGRQADEPQLRRIHSLKTGALFRAAVRMGGILAGAGEEDLDRLGRYATHFGLAFQIWDDVLDVTGDAALTGRASAATPGWTSPPTSPCTAWKARASAPTRPSDWRWRSWSPSAERAGCSGPWQNLWLTASPDGCYHRLVTKRVTHDRGLWVAQYPSQYYLFRRRA